MVQKSGPAETAKRRGRPRGYDPEVALGQATTTFWNQGFAGASLDDLSAATGMNRPSLYGAFGDKQALFRAALDAYIDQSRARMTAAFRAGGTLRQTLERTYHAALDVYLSGEVGGRGCFVVSAGLGQAVVDPEVRTIVADGLHELDRGFAHLFARAHARGELAPGADHAALARVAGAVLNALSVRARAGETPAQLDATIKATLDLLCGPQASE
ncbi:TetR/AcrR family transcriptional regulator [soil metagenome]